MVIFWKEIDDLDAAWAAIRSGMLGAALYAVWVIFSWAMGYLFGDAGTLFPLLSASSQLTVIAIAAGQLGVAIFAVWRFLLGKGAIAGILNALVLVGEVVLDLINQIFLGIIWYAVLLGILLALINGVRGALAIRELHDPSDDVQAFE
jgi:hypothetical protein